MKKDDLFLTSDENEYMNKVCATILEKISPDDLDKLGVAVILSMLDPKIYRSMILTLIAQGYMLRDEIDMSKSHKFNIDDFLKDK